MHKLKNQSYRIRSNKLFIRHVFNAGKAICKNCSNSGPAKPFWLGLFILLAVSVGGCSEVNELNDKNADDIINEAREILSNENDFKNTYIKAQDTDYPAISALDPRGITVRKEGLYIKLKEGFVTERGLFIPRLKNENKVFPENGDPGYRRIQDSLYWYEFH